MTLKLLDYQYDEGRKLVLWKIQILAPEQPPQKQVITLAILESDLVQKYGKDAVTVSETFKKRPWPFKMDMKVMGGVVPNKMGDMNEEGLLQAHSIIDVYPYYEVIDKIKEGTL